ncbi:MAG: ATP-binding protein, partial [Anaerolineae bacterium]
YRTLSASHAVTLAPVFGDWKGSGSPVVALIGRTGQLVQFSLFDSASNYNAVIAAPSGTGKSFLTNELLVTTLSVGGRCWVIDVGRSYEKTCAALGGKFAAFTRETSPSFNPFCMIEDWDEEADVIAGITAAMIAPTQTLSDFHSAALQETLKRVWDEHGREMTLDAVAAALRASTDQRIRDMGQQLFVFTTQGEYGRYFSGRAAIELDNSFVVLELEELKQRKHLQRVILLQLIYRIQQEMFHGDRAQQKIVLIDEAWDLLAESDAAKFIEVGYRRFRKYGGAAIIATQSLNDLYTNPVGRAIAENSAHTLLLAQPGNAIDQLLAENRLPIGASGARMLKSVHTVPGAYSEIMVLSDRGGGVGRLIVDPFTRLLYTTEPGEVAALQGLRSRGLSYERAIQVLLGAQTHA